MITREFLFPKDLVSSLRSLFSAISNGWPRLVVSALRTAIVLTASPLRNIPMSERMGLMDYTQSTAC